MSTEKIIWQGSRDKCNICKDDISNTHFVDGKVTVEGLPALMCLSYHEHYGFGFGTGRGQLYNEEGVKIK